MICKQTANAKEETLHCFLRIRQSNKRNPLPFTHKIKKTDTLPAELRRKKDRKDCQNQRSRISGEKDSQNLLSMVHRDLQRMGRQSQNLHGSVLAPLCM